MEQFAIEDVEFILGNSNPRFSGVTSTMLQVLPYVSGLGKTIVLGKHHLPENVGSISFWQAARYLRKPMGDGRNRLFHARRNNEMIQALLLKYIFRAKLNIIFTSTAQRKKTWFTRWLMKQMDGIISTCTAAAGYIPDGPDVIIPHGVNSTLFNPQRNDSEETIRLGTKYNIGLFGRIRAQKGVDLLVDAAIKVLPDFPDWGVVFVGEITPEQKAFAKEQQLKLSGAGIASRVVFTGKLPFQVIPEYFRQMDIVCALSINEGFGLTVLEGAASGKPVIATRAGAWPDILAKADIGCLVDIGDLQSLVERLTYLMNSKETRIQMGKNARKLVQEGYTVEREAEQLVQFYRSVISQS